jgi:ribosome-binding protein aMBF1 (putative translation factor)
MEHQDWNPVVLRGRNLSQAVVKETHVKKNPEAQRLAKLEREEFGKPRQLSSDSRKALVAGRLALSLTQDQLNQRCSFPPHTIKAFESGHLTPSGGQLNRLNRELKISLHLD